MTASVRNQHFVSANELAKLITDPNPPVILDVRNENGVPDGRPHYEAGHIPGAVYVDLPTELQGKKEGFSGGRPLPTITDLQESARGWGISNGDAVVVYDNVFGTKAGRAWFILRWAGLENVRLLDGGYRAWVDGGHEISVEEPKSKLGDVELSAGHLNVLDADDAAALAEEGALYDARGYDQFVGSEAEGAGRSGHIPGAILASTRENLTEDGFLQDEETLRERFASLGIDGSRTVGVYCGGGVAAAHELAVLTSLGLPASLYVGSFSAWSSDPNRVVATGV